MEKKRQGENANSGIQREPILKCPECGFPFFGSKKTAQECKVRIKKVWFYKPYFFDIPTPEEFEIDCPNPKCGKTCHVKLQPPASISFLMNYLRRILYRLKKREAMKSKRRTKKSSR